MSKKLSVLVTAGPTREFIDPVRFISNASSGLTGCLIAGAAAQDKASVTLISGPSAIPPPAKTRTVKADSAEEMFIQAMKYFPGADIFISSAAVCDYAPSAVSKKKLKKSSGVLTLKLQPTRDILFEAGRMLRSASRADTGGKFRLPKVLVGFALETGNIIKNAKEKLLTKNLDLVVANTPRTIGAKTIEAFLMERSGKLTKTGRLDKRIFARVLWNKAKEIHAKKTAQQRPG